MQTNTQVHIIKRVRGGDFASLFSEGLEETPAPAAPVRRETTFAALARRLAESVRALAPARAVAKAYDRASSAT